MICGICLIVCVMGRLLPETASVTFMGRLCITLGVSASHDIGLGSNLQATVWPAQQSELVNEARMHTPLV
jgi:hypothetical protein